MLDIRYRRQRLTIRCLQDERKVNSKGTALPFDTFDFDTTPMGLDNLFAVKHTYA
jgi:hypothetical protein